MEGGGGSVNGVGYGWNRGGDKQNRVVTRQGGGPVRLGKGVESAMVHVNS